MPVVKKDRTFPAGSPAMKFEAPPIALEEKPVVIVARTAGEAQHGHWGRCVHDFAGMIEPAGPIGIDFAHDDEQSIGVCDSLAIEDNQLVARGRIVPFTADDQASKVIHQASKGIPFQSSIRMATAGLEVEVVPAGATVEVNGGTFTGPGNVFRRWGVEGVAILNYGSDASTSVHFNRGTPESANDFRAQGQRFRKAFGAKGLQWFVNGKNFAEASKLFSAEKEAEATKLDAEIAKLKAEIERLKAEIATAKGKADFRRGQGTPVGSRELPPKNFGADHVAQSKFEQVTKGRSVAMQSFVDGVKARMPQKM